MKKSRLLIASIACMAMLSSCAVSYPIQVLNNKSEKVGVAEHTYILGLPWAFNVDLSIKTAAQNGNITKVASVERTVRSRFLGFVMDYSTVVTGE